jgi:hypothetical protein
VVLFLFVPHHLQLNTNTRQGRGTMVERGRSAALLVAVVLCAVFVAGSAALDWSEVDQILQAGVQDGAYPGCVALVGNKNVRSPNCPRRCI